MNEKLRIQSIKMIKASDMMIRIALDQVLPKSLTIRYIAALVAVATLAISGQVIIQTSLARQSNDHRKIRTLENLIHDSENLRKAILALQLSSHRSEIRAQIEILRSLVSQVPKNYEDLIEPDSALRKVDSNLKAMIRDCPT